MKTSHKLLRIGLIILLSATYNYSKGQDNFEKAKLNAIINLSKFVDWYPKKDNGENVLFIYSEHNSSINYEIQSKNNFKYKDWQIICSDKSDEISNNSIVFITNEKQSASKEIIQLSKDKNLLVVGDNIANFCQDGGAINLISRNGDINFEINYMEIQNQNIEISAKLLTLSKIL